MKTKREEWHHAKILTGLCKVCGHYGTDCIGTPGTDAGLLGLTICDWQEIGAALWTKKHAIANGDYDPEDGLGENQKWIAHLEEIEKKIGPDGDKAITATSAPDCNHEHNK